MILDPRGPGNPALTARPHQELLSPGVYIGIGVLMVAFLALNLRYSIQTVPTDEDP